MKKIFAFVALITLLAHNSSTKCNEYLKKDIVNQASPLELITVGLVIKWFKESNKRPAIGLYLKHLIESEKLT